MVTTRRQEMQQADGGGGARDLTAAAAARSRGANGSILAAAHADGASLTPEQHRARLDEYRAAWAPPKTLAGRVHA